MMMQPYQGYFIEGNALLVHPVSPDWYVGGSVLVSGRSSSIVEITRFQLQQFTVSMKELAEWFGLEVARLVVDESPMGSGLYFCCFAVWEQFRRKHAGSN
jgi:hypothetical protein